MKYSIALVALFAAITMAGPQRLVRRRFGQEQAPAGIIGKASALFTDGTDSGRIAQFAGGSISLVLGAADPCGIYDLGDEMITFGTGKLAGAQLDEFVNIVRDAIAVEKNFNPFSADPRASICLDAAKPASAQLRGILPLVDPALNGAAAANTQTAQNNAAIKSGGVDGVAQALGKSIGQQMIDVISFTDFQKSETLGAAAGGGAGAGAGAGAAGGAAAPTATPTAAADATGGAAPAATPTAAAANEGAAGGEDSAAIIARIEQNLAALKAACGADAAGVAGGAGGAAAPTATPTADAAGGAAPAATPTADAAGGAAPAATPTPDAAGGAAPTGTPAPQAAAATEGNLQKSTSALGGIPPPSVTNDGSDRPFKVEDNDSFLNVAAALTRSCDVQANKCQNKFNSGDRGDLKQGDCDNQRTVCNAANA